MQNLKVFGPEVPPSKWPLQGVPPPILDALKAYVMAFDMVENTKGTLRKDYCPFPEAPEFVPFGPNTQSLSLVCKSFRDNITARGVFNHIEFKTPGSVHLINEKLGGGARSHVT